MNNFIYHGSNGQAINARGFQATEPPMANVSLKLDDGAFLSNFRNIMAVNRLNMKDFLDYFVKPNDGTQDFIDNRSVLRMVRPDGLDINNFQTDVVVPMIMVRSLAVMTAAMASNYNAVFLLSDLLLPKESPGPRPTFKYITQENEIRMARPGTLHELSGRSTVTQTEMQVSLRSYTNGINVPDPTIFYQTSREQIMMQLEKELVNFSEGWKACIARLHYQYCAAQPKFSELYIANNKNNIEARGRLGVLLELINVENTLEGCINRDPSNVSKVFLSACHMIRAQGNDFVIVCPKRIVPPESGAIIMTKIPYEETVYTYTTSGADSNNMVMNVDWSTSLVKNALADPRIVSVSAEADQPKLDDRMYATLLYEDSLTYMRMPAVQNAGAEPIPIILLDDQPLSRDGPSMAQPLMNHCVKRLFYTVGAVPGSYAQYKHKAFYDNNCSIKMGEIASHSPRSSFIVNYDENATPKEVTLAQLHPAANTVDLFSFDKYIDRMRETFPPAFFESPVMRGARNDNVSYIKNALVLYHEQDSSVKLQNPLCVLESSPRNMIFPVKRFAQNQNPEPFVAKPRFCMWNYSLMSTTHAEYVGVQSGIKCAVGENEELVQYLNMCYAGFGDVSTNSVLSLLVAKSVSFITMTAVDMNNLIREALVQFRAEEQAEIIRRHRLTDDIVTRPAGGQPAAPPRQQPYDPQRIQAVTPDQANCARLLKYILQMVNYVVETKGKTLVVADPYAQCVYCVIVGLLHEQLAALDTPAVASYFDFKNKMADAVAIAQIIQKGQLAFVKAVEATGVNMIYGPLYPHSISSNIDESYQCDKGFITYYCNHFAAVACNQEYVLRTYTDNQNEVYAKNICGVLEPVRVGGALNNTRPWGTILMDRRIETHFSYVDGKCKVARDRDTAPVVQTGRYQDSFFCRSNLSIAERVNETLFRMPNDMRLGTILPVVGRRLNAMAAPNIRPALAQGHNFFPFNHSTVAAGAHVYLFNVSTFRLDLTPENTHSTFQYYSDVGHAAVGLNIPGINQPFLPNNPWTGIFSPTFIARRTVLMNELNGMPLNLFLMATHYYSSINYKNVVNRFDKNYYSGWSYLCVRTMRYVGHSAVAMPRKKALQVHGMKAMTETHPSDTARFINSQIDMNVIPAHMGAHGCVFPNVFITDIEGVNTLFLKPDTIPALNNNANRGDFIRSSTVKDMSNFTLVIDWYNGLLPETLSGTSKTCETVLPLNGKYVQMDLSPAGNNNRYSALDPVTMRFCESPVLLPYSDSAYHLAERGRLLQTLMYRDNPASSFVGAAHYNNLDETMGDQTFGRLQMIPANQQELFNALFQRSLANNAVVETPFTGNLGLMFADSYVVGQGGGLYLIKAQNNLHDNDQFDLNPRVVGESISPTYLFTPADNAAMLHKFTNMTGIPHMSKELVNVYNAIDTGALANLKQKR